MRAEEEGRFPGFGGLSKPRKDSQTGDSGQWIGSQHAFQGGQVTGTRRLPEARLGEGQLGRRPSRSAASWLWASAQEGLQVVPVAAYRDLVLLLLEGEAAPGTSRT